MENKFGLTDLSDHELKEFNGGMFMSVISLFLATGKKVLDLVVGVDEGYYRGTKI
jgi:hypothetical protein